jgi:hypothetical protein
MEVIMKKGKLRTLSDGKVAFYCKGCKCYHAISIEEDKHPTWSFNGDYEKPTFNPSILVQYRYPKGYTNENPAPVGYDGEFVDNICHSFIVDGKIQYLSDCTHQFAGITLEL